MGNDEQKGIDAGAVADQPEQLGAGLDQDEAVESLKGMREVPSESGADAGEARTDD